MVMFDRRVVWLSCLVLAWGCGTGAATLHTSGSGGAAGTGGAPATSAGTGGTGGPGVGASGATTASVTAGSGGAPPCTTRVSYGDAWIHPAGHPDLFDDVTGPLTWDGTCTDDGGNSFAVLSNGWKPYFTGPAACLLALDTTCPGAPACTTRITYGAAWLPPANHPATYDDVPGRVWWDRTCTTQGSDSAAVLSNGWAPHFTGAGACALSFDYQGCGGLYQNAVIPEGCADPGVLRDGSTYLVACTSGDDADAFPLRTSPDLVHWTAAGYIFPSARKPSWAMSDFWAPEIHAVGAGYVAYFTARHQDGILSIGAATATSSLGPFTDVGQPLVHDAVMGMIDPTEIEDGSGNRYLVWKEDGNAVGKPTPIYGQALSPDGTALVGARTTLITNDLPWEGAVVEGPWIVAHGGSYYLFYSGNSYANSSYAVGVARSAAVLGPYQKAAAPILATDAGWVGPGHCSVVDTPAGDTAIFYHAWEPGHVNGPGDVRVGMLDTVVWSGGWPAVPEAPSVGSRPVP